MLATIAHMAMCRVHLSDADLELAAMVLRALAARYRNGAKREANPIVRQGFEKHASMLDLRPRVSRGSQLRAFDVGGRTHV